MAKAKTSPSPAKSKGSSLPDGLGEQLEKAIALLEGKKYAEAAKAFKALQGASTDRGLLGLERTVRTYLALIPDASAGAAAPETPEMEAQVLLNRGDVDQALSLLDKAVKAHAGKAQLHYLRGLALARKGQAEDSAEALKKAFSLDAELVFVYGLETDFDAMRRQPAFAALERM